MCAIAFRCLCQPRPERDWSGQSCREELCIGTFQGPCFMFANGLFRVLKGCLDDKVRECEPLDVSRLFDEGFLLRTDADVKPFAGFSSGSAFDLCPSACHISSGSECTDSFRTVLS